MVEPLELWGALLFVVICALAQELTMEGLGIKNKENKSEPELSKFKDEYGDLLSIEVVEGLEFRVAVRDESKIWENATVPYEISSDYSNADREVIMSAMRDFRNRTCVRFRRRRGEPSYIRIRMGSGCSAGVGKPQRENAVSLGDRCLVKGVVIHELMHTLGFFHEQNRPDRDKFVRVDFDNIIEGAELNFAKLPEDGVQTLNVSYDYGSVLHYGRFDFAKDRSRPTIVPLREGAEIGQREGFSEMDVIKINLLYNCTQLNETENDAVPDLEEEETDSERRRRRRKERRRSFLSFFFKFFNF